ncbi:MAG: hypothetical protein ABI604_13715 [Nitrospirota bacterium]
MRWKPNPEPNPDPLSPDPYPLPAPEPPIPNPPPYPNPPIRPPIPQLVGWPHRRDTALHFLLLCLAVLMGLAALLATPVAAAPVSVRFPEGGTHGFLLVRSLVGDIVGHGEITQRVSEGDVLESHLVFRFEDGSLHDETVAFLQQRVFTLLTYRLVQRGPSFPEQLDATIDRGSAQYTVRSQRGTQGKEDVQSGHFDLPKDVYNGMLIMVSQNLPKGADATVSVLAFTPAPKVVPVQIHAREEQSIQIGDRSSTATQFVFTPELGMIQEWLGKVTGKLPAEFHYDCWLMVEGIPSFVQYEGPLQLLGPILRIELVSPRLHAKPDEKKLSLK